MIQIKKDDSRVLEDKEKFSRQQETTETLQVDNSNYDYLDMDENLSRQINEAEDSAAERALQEYEDYEAQQSQDYFNEIDQRTEQENEARANINNFVEQMNQLNNDPRVIAIAQEYRARQAEEQRRMMAEAERISLEAQNISEEAPTYKPNFFNFTELKQNIFKNCK